MGAHRIYLELAIQFIGGARPKDGPDVFGDNPS